MAEESPHQALRKATAADHCRLHQVASFAALQHGNLKLEDYKRLLLRLLGLHAPLDEQQARYQNEPMFAWMHAAPEDRRGARLQRDLAELGVPASAIEAAPSAKSLLPRTENSAAALGCAWVVEGSALGGRIIAKLLQDHLGIMPATGGAFFAPLPQQPARWSACCAAVETLGRQAGPLAEMQEAARATMNAFADWMEAVAT